MIHCRIPRVGLQRAATTFWIALLYGWSAGFIFDEMGMWLNSSTDQGGRWDRTGVFVGAEALMASFLLAVLLNKQLAQDQKFARVPVRVAGIEFLPAPEEE
jgi:hypothetical protein